MLKAYVIADGRKNNYGIDRLVLADSAGVLVCPYGLEKINEKITLKFEDSYSKYDEITKTLKITSISNGRLEKTIEIAKVIQISEEDYAVLLKKRKEMVAQSWIDYFNTQKTKVNYAEAYIPTLLDLITQSFK